MKRDKVVKEVSIIGCVTATERDDDNEASAIVISTDREDYPVEPKGLGRDLLIMEGEEVMVKGKLIIDNGTEKRVRVSAYDLIDDAYLEENDFHYVNKEFDGYDYGDDEDPGGRPSAASSERRPGGRGHELVHRPAHDRPEEEDRGAGSRVPRRSPSTAARSAGTGSDLWRASARPRWAAARRRTTTPGRRPPRPG